MGISVRNWLRFFLLFGKEYCFIEKLSFLINNLFGNVFQTSGVKSFTTLLYAKLQVSISSIYGDITVYFYKYVMLEAPRLHLTCFNQINMPENAIACGTKSFKSAENMNIEKLRFSKIDANIYLFIYLFIYLHFIYS